MSTTRRVVVVGATGMIGQALSRRLIEQGYELVVFSRDAERARTAIAGAAEYVNWQPQLDGPWAAAIDGAYAVVMLAGAPFFTRWTPEVKQEIRSSRELGTQGLLNAMARAQVKPAVFIGGSSVGFYGFEKTHRDERIDESFPAGQDFWGQDSQELEQEALKAEKLGVRTVLLRTGIVLDRTTGMLSQILPQYERGFGGTITPGTQWFPWIHIDDMVGLILFAIENQRVQGPLNATGPEPVRQREFAQTLGRVLGKRTFMIIPGFILKRALGPVAVTTTQGRRVVPKKAQDLGYNFHYKTCEEALENLLADKVATPA